MNRNGKWNHVLKLWLGWRDKIQPMLAKNFQTQLNYDALLRELIHAVNANLERIDKDEIYAPCDFVVRCSKSESDHLKRLKKFDLYQQKLEKSVQKYIREKGYLTKDKTIRVRLEADGRLDTGFVQIDIAFELYDASKYKTVYRPPGDKTLAYVEWLNGPHKGDKVPITRSKALIGRIADDNHPDIGIEDNHGWVGRRHGEIEQRGDHFILRDLGSQNGTKLEKAGAMQALAPDTPVELTDQAIVLLADEFRLRFHISNGLLNQTRISQ